MEKEKNLKKSQKKEQEKHTEEEMIVEKETSTHNFKTKPIILKLDNGTTIHAQSVSLSDVNVSDYLK